MSSFVSFPKLYNLKASLKKYKSYCHATRGSQKEVNEILIKQMALYSYNEKHELGFVLGLTYNSHYKQSLSSSRVHLNIPISIGNEHKDLWLF